LTRHIATPGFILLTTALVTIVGGVVTSLAWIQDMKRNDVVMVFDIGVSLAVLTSILLTETEVPPLGAMSAVPAFVILAHTSLGPLGRNFLGLPLLLLLVTLSRIAYAFRSLSKAWRLGKGIVLGVDSTLVQLALVSTIAILSGASIVYIAEAPDPASPIKSFGDALWWAIATATTVGYGDVVPVTRLGRLTASILMIIGIGSLGIFISDMAVRVARILMAEDYDRLPVLEREKRRIMRMISRIEELSDEEVESLVRKIKVLHLLTRSTSNDNILEVIINGSPDRKLEGEGVN